MSDSTESLRERVDQSDAKIASAAQVPSALDSESKQSPDSLRVQNQPALWLKRADQWMLGFLLMSLLVLLGAFRWKLSGGGRSEIEIVSQQPREFLYSIDINKASWVEWAQLDGIGEKLGRRIVKDREDHGPFKSVDDLIRIRGIGAKFLDKVRPFVRCKLDDLPRAGEQSVVKEPR